MSKLSYKYCFCFRRRFKLEEAEAPKEIKDLFGRYSENGIMSPDQLLRFLVEVQKQNNATLEDAQAIIDKLVELKHLNIFHRKGLHLEAFFKYLFGDVNPPVDPKLGVHNDMTAPLSHYFVYTGHNSYLTGNQLSSDCSDEPIIRALLKGVRVIELDIWPNPTKSDVHVLHGRTLTTPVQLIKCLKSIKEHAFTASDYPVVITLEDHLTPDLQENVAKMVTQTFGDMLYTPGSDTLRDFPSPESLKKRIIISTKPPKEYLQVKDVKEKEKPAADGEVWGREISDLKYRALSNEKVCCDADKNIMAASLLCLKFCKQKEEEEKDEEEEEKDEEDEEDDEDDEGGEGDLDEEGHKLEHQAPPEYKRLIGIHAGKPKGGLKECLKVDPIKVRRLSLSEQQLRKAVEAHGREIIRFTQRNILRVYPKGLRIDSSNYNPLLGWTHGAQMVAFNMQGYGRLLWVMQGMFKANGGCGYVKKPEFLLKSGPHGVDFDPKVARPVKKRLKVKVYMGEGWYDDFSRTHFDSYSPPDFYARVGIAGVPADTKMERTRAIEDSWIPVWNQEFVFPLTVPELALLRVEVHEYDITDKDDFGGQTCLPVSELQQGIRSVPLHDNKGEKYQSVKLLMRFEFV